jgi:prepilin-type N-terminal cleavage/methylation domain-containing protein
MVVARFPDRSNAGFTLLETLVAMACLALMAAYGVQAIGNFSAIRRIEQSVARHESVQAARLHLRQVTSGARPSVRLNEAGQTLLEFEGSSEVLKVSAVLDDRLVSGRLQRISYELVDSDLVLRFEQPRPDGTLGQQKVVLLTDVSKLSFQYFGKPGESPDSKWQTVWKENQLPQAIRIDAVLGGGTTTQWHTLYVSLALAR